MQHPDTFQFVPKKGCGYVYHIVSGSKHYIGISTTPFSRRWFRHRAPDSGCTKLARELRRLYATNQWDQLKVEILQEAKNQQLDKLQKKYIKKFGSYNSMYGLNSTPGGRDITPDSMHKKRKPSPRRRVRRTPRKKPFTWDQIY